MQEVQILLETLNAIFLEPNKIHISIKPQIRETLLCGSQKANL